MIDNVVRSETHFIKKKQFHHIPQPPFPKYFQGSLFSQVIVFSQQSLSIQELPEPSVWGNEGNHWKQFSLEEKKNQDRKGGVKVERPSTRKVKPKFDLLMAEVLRSSIVNDINSYSAVFK